MLQAFQMTPLPHTVQIWKLKSTFKLVSWVSFLTLNYKIRAVYHMITPSIYGWEIGKACFFFCCCCCCCCFYFLSFLSIIKWTSIYFWKRGIITYASYGVAKCRLFSWCYFSRTSIGWKYCLFFMRDIFWLISVSTLVYLNPSETCKAR